VGTGQQIRLRLRLRLREAEAKARNGYDSAGIGD
jgi:hypothetical protein